MKKFLSFVVAAAAVGFTASSKDIPASNGAVAAYAVMVNPK